MLAEERRQKLSEIVSERGFVPLPELVQLIGVSESTVRRDLEHLHEAGILRRTHGGAIAAGEAAGALTAFDDRTLTQVSEKRLVAQRMAEIIQDGETVLIDGGTTTYELARQLMGRHLQIVTNSLPIATLCAASREIDLVLLGGYVYPKTGVALGELAQASLRDLHAHRLIMSVGGLTAKGLYNSNLLLVETERAMMACADEIDVIADHTKFGRQALTHLCDWSGVDRVVVDDGINEEQRRMIGSEVDVVIVDRADGTRIQGEKS
ncbi:Glycerol-3-phosphate regulon repressor [Planctomycetes bacterium Pan216]|uniref:Glycerol-3-phosphate regulon repressor n=1 Tax=Kolteria novifilia TaxID=2527975 RepID=A0A518B9N1_9BACT|nr:Glycerol-3-phosphate regulon repressor [Planctomycetes bacterium Pan216]